MSYIISSGVISGGYGENEGDRDGIISLGRGLGEREWESGVGDFMEEMGEMMGAKWDVGEGSEFNSGDPSVNDDESGADSDERSETIDVGEGVT